MKTYFDRTVYDIVFFGNGLVENLDGASMNKDVPEAAYYRDFFRNEFTFESEESIVDSVALGIEGDMVRVSFLAYIFGTSLLSSHTHTRRRPIFCGDSTTSKFRQMIPTLPKTSRQMCFGS